MSKRIFEKYKYNPVMTPDMLPTSVLYTFNPGAIKHNGEYILMMDCTTLDDIHRFWIARSKDGYMFTPDPKPVNWPDPDPTHPELCTYDPRITKIGDEYIILYASDLSQNEVRVGIVRTKDFEKFERVSIGSDLGNRNGCLFPERIDNLYVRLDRPFTNELNPCSMWVSYSPDLVFWGKSRPVMYKGKPFCDGFKMGAGAVPIRTDKGWLEIYHTVSKTCNGFIYYLKACLLDLQDPSQVIGYTKDILLWPEHDYEMQGRVMNVVFTCNALLEDNGMIKIYYGAGDTNIGLAEGKINDIIEACLAN
ncbi:MAG TPA: glycosidase [Ruminococcaceae bacterium]|jgi:beta-1,4-mannooligosaccharide/beta-1,4-mannosyl-N-acetylglucosamine phosphorylase|nr:glycosidase [Oscillospiraceae bacterium]